MRGRITIEEAGKSLPQIISPILEKFQHYDHTRMVQVIQECRLPANLSSKLATKRAYTREDLHCLRLLRRGEAERTFALAYLEHRDAISLEDVQTFTKIRSVIGSEGMDTIMFWTFAPYLFKVMKARGLSDQDAIRKILFWAKDGVSSIVDAYKRYKYRRIDYARFHLAGLKKYTSQIPQGWVLDKDPNHLSHRFTEQEAEEIAEILLGETTK